MKILFTDTFRLIYMNILLKIKVRIKLMSQLFHSKYNHSIYDFILHWVIMYRIEPRNNYFVACPILLIILQNTNLLMAKNNNKKTILFLPTLWAYETIVTNGFKNYHSTWNLTQGLQIIMLPNDFYMLWNSLCSNFKLLHFEVDWKYFYTQ